MLFSTRGQDGGAGQAMALVLGEGQRAPRAWEIVLTGWGHAWWRGKGGAGQPPWGKVERAQGLLVKWLLLGGGVVERAQGLLVKWLLLGGGKVEKARMHMILPPMQA